MKWCIMCTGNIFCSSIPYTIDEISYLKRNMSFRINVIFQDSTDYMLLGIKSKTYFGQLILSNANLWIICICMGVTLQREAWSRYTVGYQIWTFQRLFNDKPTTWCMHVYQYILLLFFLFRSLDIFMYIQQYIRVCYL